MIEIHDPEVTKFRKKVNQITAARNLVPIKHNRVGTIKSNAGPSRSRLDRFESVEIKAFVRRKTLKHSISVASSLLSGNEGKLRAKISFDTNKPVDERMKLPAAGSHFANFGLRKRDEPGKPKHFWQWPIFGFFTHTLFLCRSVFIVVTQVSDREVCSCQIFSLFHILCFIIYFDQKIC